MGRQLANFSVEVRLSLWGKPASARIPLGCDGTGAHVEKELAFLRKGAKVAV